MAGGPVIAVAVFVAGPKSEGTTEPVSLRHFLRGLVTQSPGLQFGGAMRVACMFFGQPYAKPVQSDANRSA